MPNRLRPELTPTVAVEAESSGSAGAVAALPLVPAGGVAGARTRPSDQRGSLLRRLLLVADVAALCLAFLAMELAFDTLHSLDIPLLVFGIPMWVLLAYAHRLYHLDSFRADYGAADEIGPVLQMATLWSWGTLLALALIGSDDVPVARMALLWALAVLLLTAFRSAVRAIARRRSWYRQDALIIGPTAQADAIARKLERHPEWGIEPRAFVDVPVAEWSPGSSADPLEVASTAPTEADLIALVEKLAVDRVMLTPSLSESRSRVELVSELAQLGVHVDLIPSWSKVVGSRLELHEMEGMPLLTLPRARLGRSAMYLKRAFDLIAGSLAVLALAPVLVACAIAIKVESPGPVLFRQRRVGRDNRRFQVLKFRSMYDGADTKKQEVARLNLHGGGTETGMFKIRRDPRITRVGRFLRRYSLDELPQLFNVLRGEMSVVGPRPLIESEDRRVGGRFRRRLAITPGLTGLWQVSGRSEIPFDEMVSLDYLYVTNWSLWGDIKLLMRTVTVVLRGKGAY
jgi:exopolysaccharide biosynthesis polyprenyl glycosylphosphotransferase